MPQRMAASQSLQSCVTYAAKKLSRSRSEICRNSETLSDFAPFISPLLSSERQLLWLSNQHQTLSL